MKWLSPSSIRIRLFFLACAMLVPIALLLMYNVYQQREYALKSARENAERIMDFAILQEEEILRGTRQILGMLADIPAVARGGRECNELLGSLLENAPQYTNFGVARRNGEVYCSALPLEKPVDISDRSYFRDAVEKRSFSIGEFQVGRITSKPAINFGYPVLDKNGNVTAVVYAALDLDRVAKLEYEVDAQTPANSSYVKLDRNGSVLSSYPVAYVFGRGSPLEKPLFEKISTERKGMFVASGVDGVNRLYVFSSLRGPLYRDGIYLLLGIPTQTLFAEFNRQLVWNLSVLGAALLLALAAMWIGGRRLIVRPVEVLVDASKRLAAGDLAARTGLTSTPGELGHLGRAFDQMAADLERKKQNLSETRKRLASILSTSPAIVFTYAVSDKGQSDPEYIPTFVSDRIRDWFGYEPREIEGNASWWKQNVHPEDLPAGRWGRSRLDQETVSREYRFREKGGNYRWVLDRSALRRDKEGNPVEVVGSWTDITENRLAQEQVKNALRMETVLRTIDTKILAGERIEETLQVVCDAIVAMGYRICWVGLAEPDGTVRPVASRGFDEGYLESMRFRWDDAPEGGGPTGIAIRTRRPCVIHSIAENGLYAPWRQVALERGYRSSASIPLISGQGDTVGVLHAYAAEEGAFTPDEVARLEIFAQQCAITVINARRIEDLRDANQRLKFHVNRMPLAYIVWDADFKVAEWNPAAEWIFGWKAEEALGRHPYELIVPLEEWPHTDKVWSKLLAGDQSSYSLNANTRKDGKKITCEWFNSPLREAGGKINGVLSMAHDVTEKTQLERQLQTAQRMEAVGTLAGGIAHDFNNALTGIFGFSEMIRPQLAGNERALSNLEEVLRCAQRASTLTRQLLTYSRRQIIDPVNLNLNSVITELLKLVSKVVGEHIDLRTFLARDLPTIRADVGQMEQVVMNLALNARDAMPGGGQLVVETGLAILDAEYVRFHPYMGVGSYVVLTISDTGIGMDQKTQERVFEPFFTTKGPERGTGLGLAMVYGIVKQHNGFIHLYSEPGKGTTFKIYFPPVEAAPDVIVSSDASEVRGGSETILLAEDDESVRTLAERTLTELGYTVLSARNGEDAIDVFNRSSEKISLAVLDVVMPVKGGKEAYEVLQKVKPGLKVIFMSGYTANAVHESFVLIAGVPFLAKPFGPAALARKVREVLDKA